MQQEFITYLLTFVWPGVCISSKSFPRFHGPLPFSLISTSAVETSTCGDPNTMDKMGKISEN